MQKTKSAQELIFSANPEVRKHVLEKLMENGKLNIKDLTDETLLKTALKICENKYMFGSGAIIAKKLGDIVKAQELFEKQMSWYEHDGKYGEAALLALEMGNKQRANILLEKQFFIYENSHSGFKFAYTSDLKNAAQLALKIGDKYKAMNYYEKGGWFDQAGDMAVELGEYEKAIGLYLKDKYGDYHYEKAGDLAIKVGDFEKAYDLYQSQITFALSRPLRYGGKYVYNHCARIALKLNDKTKAQEYFEKSEDFYSAAKVALDLGKNNESTVLFERQILVYEKLGEFEKAATVARNMGDIKRASGLEELSHLLR